MKVSCLQENLAQGLSTVGRAVATRSTLPILSNVMLATDQGRLKLSATDLEIGINCWVGAQVEEEGAITVPARLLIDLVNSLPAERIDMELNVRTQELHLQCAHYEANIKGLDAQEFPLIPTAEEGDYELMLDPNLLRQMIEQVALAAATDESRPILTGVLVKFDGSQLSMAAADGFRLSVRRAQMANEAPEPISVVIPARALAELGRISSGQELPISLNITSSRSQALFRLSNTDLVSQLIEGRFPDYEQIIPKHYDTQTTVNTEAFLKACRTANIFARNEANIIRLKIGQDKMEIAARSAEMGDNIGEIDAQVEGEPIEIAFNVRFLIDLLSVIGVAQVILQTTTPSSPGVIKMIGSEDFVHVIMPMHVRND
ncbi:MAG: DNA polymerase III subunit beta [Anaerolineaceae bacterium 4572_32.1]|nr:MAG: DNA polymerase III subunit beta [Anaerolineaceae bacterium 4572_32.1]